MAGTLAHVCVGVECVECLVVYVVFINSFFLDQKSVINMIKRFYNIFIFVT